MQYETQTRKSCSVNSSPSNTRLIQTYWSQISIHSKTSILNQALLKRPIIRITHLKVNTRMGRCIQHWGTPLQKLLRKRLKWYNRKVMEHLLPTRIKHTQWSVNLKRKELWALIQLTSAFKTLEWATIRTRVMMLCWRTYWRFLILSSSNHHFQCWVLKSNIGSSCQMSNQ